MPVILKQGISLTTQKVNQNISIDKSMTLGKEVAETSKADTILAFTQKVSSTRPNLNISKQTDLKLEEIARYSSSHPANSDKTDQELIVTTKVVNITNQSKSGFNKQQNRKLDNNQTKNYENSNKTNLMNREKLNKYLLNITVTEIFICFLF